jgi:hypothetical protein
MTWTDGRMDDLATRMDAGFERIDTDIRELRRDLRSEIRANRDELRSDIGALRDELKGDIGDVKGEITELRKMLTTFGIALVVGLISVIGTLVGVVASGALG